MERFILAAIVLFATSATAQAQNFYFVSQNSIIDGQEAEFEQYQDIVQPIMARHGASYILTDVVDVLSGHDHPDVVNFGDMGPPEQVQAFFTDPEFQAAFPTLMAILDDHLSYATDGDLASVTSLASGTILLMATSTNHAALNAIDVLDATQMIGHWDILRSTRGLGPAASAEEQPGMMVVWELLAHLPEDGSAIEGVGSAFLLRVR